LRRHDPADHLDPWPGWPISLTPNASFSGGAALSAASIVRRLPRVRSLCQEPSAGGQRSSPRRVAILQARLVGCTTRAPGNGAPTRPPGPSPYLNPSNEGRSGMTKDAATCAHRPRMLPGPEEPEAGSLPADDGLGLDHGRHPPTRSTVATAGPRTAGR